MDAGQAEQAVAVGEALLKARGSMSRAKAVRLSGLSVQWWVDAEKGMRRDRGEMVPTVLRPQNLASAIQAVGGDVRSIFELAGMDPAPFMDDDTVTQHDIDVAEELHMIRVAVQELVDLYGQLARAADVASSPPEPEERSGIPEALEAAVRSAKRRRARSA